MSEVGVEFNEEFDKTCDKFKFSKSSANDGSSKSSCSCDNLLFSVERMGLNVLGKVFDLLGGAQDGDEEFEREMQTLFLDDRFDNIDTERLTY